jgi:hypothetical protein
MSSYEARRESTRLLLNVVFAPIDIPPGQPPPSRQQRRPLQRALIAIPVVTDELRQTSHLFLAILVEQ